MLTAAHCGGSSTLYDGNHLDPELFATESETFTRRSMDSMLVNARGGTDGWVFVGGYHERPEDNGAYTRRVSRLGYNSQGDIVCTSGANTGEHCNIYVASVDNYDDMGDYNLGPYAYAWNRDDSKPFAGEGDSGGPVFRIREDGSVGARGIIIQGVLSTKVEPCNTHTKDVSMFQIDLWTCTNMEKFVQLQPILSAWGATLITP